MVLGKLPVPGRDLLKQKMIAWQNFNSALYLIFPLPQ